MRNKERMERDLKIEYALELWHTDPTISLPRLEKKTGLTRTILIYQFKKNGIPLTFFAKQQKFKAYNPHSPLADKHYQKIKEVYGEAIAEECVRVNPGKPYAAYLKKGLK
jgi:hypothetical protein